MRKQQDVADFYTVTRGLYLEGLCAEPSLIAAADVIGGGIQLFRDHTEIHCFIEEEQWIAALQLNHDNKILYSAPGGIKWLEPRSGLTGTLLDTIDGQSIRGINEMTPAANGSLYFGSIDLQSIIEGKPPGQSALFHLSCEGNVTKLDDKLSFSNGLCLGKDNKQLFHNESFTGVFAYDVQENGALANKRLLLPKVDCDGMALDVDGHIWISGFSSDELLCLNDTGAIINRLAIPAYGATNLRFGGPGYQTLYINTVAEGVAAGLAEGAHPNEQRSILYRTSAPVTGLPIRRTHFTL